MKSGELKRAKRDVRRRVLAARDAMTPADRERLGALAAERFLALPEVRAARTVLAFWSFGSELATRPLIERLHELGVRVALPRIEGGELEAIAYRPGDALRETSFGALEPATGEVLDPRSIDVVATPAVAFDRSGRRIGYGGGFYDRFLARVAPETTRVGIAFAVQLLPAGEALPAGAFDLPVDVVVTEHETLRIGAAASDRHLGTRST